MADGRAGELGRRLARRLGGRLVDLAGERFAAYRIVADDLVLDLWGRGRQPIAAELERRDLTINSLAVDLATGKLLDPFGGLADLEGRLLRATSERSFREDPLRVLRLARFAAELDGFETDPQTLALARSAAADIETVAPERLRGEIDKTLACDGRARGVKILAACGLYPRLWGGSESADVGGVAARVAALGAVRRVGDLDADLGDCDHRALSQAVLFSPPGGGTAAATSSLLLTRRLRQRVSRLLELGALPTQESEARWFLRQWGRRWCEATRFALLRDVGKGTRESYEAAGRLAELAREHGREIFDLPALLDGDEVGRLLGLAPGPEIGQALLALEREQVAGRVTTADQARAFLERRSRRRGNQDG